MHSGHPRESVKIIRTTCSVSTNHCIKNRKPVLTSDLAQIQYCLSVFDRPVNCAISCNSCPDPLEMSIEDVNAVDAVSKYGKPQRVEVSSAQ